MGSVTILFSYYVVVSHEHGQVHTMQYYSIQYYGHYAGHCCFVLFQKTNLATTTLIPLVFGLRILINVYNIVLIYDYYVIIHSIILDFPCVFTIQLSLHILYKNIFV